MSETADLEKSVKLPYIMKDKVLMGPGFWNGLNYSGVENAHAYNSTDWTDREITSLFLDHLDTGAKEWIGEIQNPIIDDTGVVMGDLYIVDKPTAMKLAYGAKFGISPKVKGDAIEGSMHNYNFANFSVVFNPAVKTAYINNSETKKQAEKVEATFIVLQENKEEELAKVTDFEATRKRLGMSVSSFYAIPRDPPSASKLPIFDAAHTRNALARINQVKGASSSEMATAKRKINAAAKKFGIKVSGDKKLQEEIEMADEETKPEETVEKKEEVSEEKKEETAPEAPKEEAKEAEPEKKEEEPASESSTDELSDTLKSIMSKVDKIHEVVMKMSEVKEPEVKEEEKKEEKVTQEMSKKEEKLEEPAAPEKIGQKATSEKPVEQKLSDEEVMDKLDEGLLVTMLKKQGIGSGLQ